MPRSPLVARAALPALLTLGLTGLACVQELPPPDEEGHVPELSVNGFELMESFPTEGGLYVSPPIELSSGANRVAIMSSLHEGAEAPALRVRGVDGAERGAWFDATWTFEELSALAGVGLLDGVYSAVQVGVPRDAAADLQDLTFSPALVEEGEEGIDLVEESVAEHPLRAELAFVGVRPRSEWNARAPRCSSRDSNFYRMALHHTAAKAPANVPLHLRQMQAYHMDGRGYCDTAYHFAITQDGRTYELRPMPFRGGHTRNNNTGNVGVVFLGCFDPACGNDIPTSTLIQTGAGMVRMMHLLENIAMDANHVRGHRDHSGASTACPGAHLHPKLEEIRSRARNWGSQPAAAPPPPPPPPPPAATTPGCGRGDPGRSLARGQGITSCDGRFTFVHQGDGNVVLYKQGAALWSTGTHGTSTSHLVMQGDGNLVLYRSNGTPAWNTGTHGNNGAFLAVQNDGNVVIYRSNGSPAWNTGTHGH